MAWQEPPDDEAELETFEDPDEEDADWNPDPATVPCPYCRKHISEEAERCPHCGSYISQEDVPRGRRWWVFAIILFLVAAFILFWR